MEIGFEAILSELGSRRIVRLPPGVSQGLPSRGMVMIRGTINGIPFLAPLEPDGKGGHWLEVSPGLSKEAGAEPGGAASFQIEPVEEWPEPEMPQDVLDALAQAGVTLQWNSITPKARWAWFRWIRATMNPATRAKRIAVACSKLEKGDKRPCCFDAASCTVPDVSKAGVLMDG